MRKVCKPTNIKGSHPEKKSRNNLQANMQVEEACVCGTNTLYNAFAASEEKPHFFMLFVPKIEQFITKTQVQIVTCLNSDSVDALKSLQTNFNILDS